MRRAISMDEYVCDGCGRVSFIEPGVEPPPGWHGTVLHVHEGGGSGGNWYACSARCIRKAVILADRDDRDDEHGDWRGDWSQAAARCIRKAVILSDRDDRDDEQQ